MVLFSISFPTGTITSSSPTAQPAEVLLQATPPHRRARSAAWSYIFLPEEAWCDLTIHLPAAVLLKELHIQPHLASLASMEHTSLTQAISMSNSIHVHTKYFGKRSSV